MNSYTSHHHYNKNNLLKSKSYINIKRFNKEKNRQKPYCFILYILQNNTLISGILPKARLKKRRLLKAALYAQLGISNPCFKIHPWAYKTRSGCKNPFV